MCVPWGLNYLRKSFKIDAFGSENVTKIRDDAKVFKYLVHWRFIPAQNKYIISANTL